MSAVGVEVVRGCNGDGRSQILTQGGGRSAVVSSAGGTVCRASPVPYFYRALLLHRRENSL